MKPWTCVLSAVLSLCTFPFALRDCTVHPDTSLIPKPHLSIRIKRFVDDVFDFERSQACMSCSDLVDTS